jgi:hypothetical protein
MRSGPWVTLAAESTAEGGVELGQLLLAGDEDRLLDGYLLCEEGWRRGWCGWRRQRCRGHFQRRRQAAPADALVELDGLGPGLDVEYLVEQLAAAVVLGEGGAAAVGEGEEVHQLAVGAFGGGVDLDPALGQTAGGLAVALSYEGGHQSSRSICRLAMEADARRGRPVLEGGAVFEGEVGEEGAAVEVESPLKVLRCRGCDASFELGYVNPDPGVGMQL